jgi:ribosomal-protein-alanine N-acetyltransferase
MNKEIIPTLETDRFLLIPPDEFAFNIYSRFYTDAEASSMYGGPITKEQAWSRLNADLGSWYLGGFGVWVVQDKKTSKLLGVCGFWQGLGWPLELTWWMLPEARGKGVAFEASKAAISCALKTFKWGVVETYMNDDNLAACNLVLKLGGKKARREVFPDGLTRSIYTFPVL